MMVLLTLCSACRNGDHKRHYEVIQAVPKGMLGGTRCPCKGDCKGNRDPELEWIAEMLNSDEREEA